MGIVPALYWLLVVTEKLMTTRRGWYRLTRFGPQDW